MSAAVDIARWRDYGFSRSRERQQGLAETNCRQAVPAVQVVAGRYGGGAPKPGWLQDGDGTDGRTGWPAVIRGRQERDRGHGICGSRECSAQYPAVKSVSSTPLVRNRSLREERRNAAPSGSPGRKSRVRVPQDIDSEVVSGQATAIPAPPTAAGSGGRTQNAGAVSGPAGGVVVPSGPWSPPSRPPAASSSWKTSSKRPSASTPNTAAPPKRPSRPSRPEAGSPPVGIDPRIRPGLDGGALKHAYRGRARPRHQLRGAWWVPCARAAEGRQADGADAEPRKTPSGIEDAEAQAQPARVGQP